MSTRADRSYTYQVRVDSSSLAAAEAEIKRRLGGSMAQIDPGLDEIRRIDPRTVAAQQQQERALLATHIETERRMTAEARSEAKIREGIARAEAAERVEGARTARIRTTEEERRITAELRQQARERDRANLQQGGRSALSQIAGVGRAAVGALAGAGVVIGAREIAQQSIALARYAVDVQRTSAAFEILSGSAGAAATKLEAVRQASGGAIDKLQAMQIANKAAALGMADTASELERVTRFATISGRVLGTDTAGALDNIALAASNLSFQRLDTMGVSASKTRDRFNELKGSMDDSKAFLQAMLEVGEATFAGMENSSLGAASGVEIFTTRLRDLKLELVGVGSGIDELARMGALKIGGGETQDFEKVIRNRIEKLQGSVLVSGIADLQSLAGFVGNSDEQVAALEALIAQMKNLDSATMAGVEGAREYQGELEGIGRASLSGPLSDAQIGKIASIVEWWNLVGQAATSAAAAIGGVADATDVAAASATMGNIRALSVLAGNVPSDELTPTERARLSGSSDPMFANTGDGPRIGDIMAEIREEERQRIEETRAQFERAIDAQEAEYKRAAERTAEAWKSAAKEAENAFKSAVGSIPGIGSPSEVTDRDMELAEYGLYREKPDEFLRQAEDELRNGNDYARVDRGEIERMVAESGGYDQGGLQAIPGGLLADLLRDEWGSGRLWENPANLQLLDLDATGAGLAQLQKGERGQANLMQHLQDSGLSAPYGIGAEFGPEITQELASGIGSAWPDAIAAVDFAGPLGEVVMSQGISPAAISAFSDVGKAGAEWIGKGFGDEIKRQPFFASLADSLYADVIARLIGALGPLNP